MELENNMRTPHDPDAERAVLSCLLRDPERLFSESRDTLEKDHFFSATHATLFKQMQHLQSHGGVDAMILISELRRCDALDEVGGAGQVAALVDDVPTTAMFPGYVGILREMRSRRDAIAKLEESMRAFYDLQVGATDSMIELSDYVNHAIESQVTHEDTKSIRQVVLAANEKIEEAHKRGGLLPGISTGFPDLDECSGGMKPGEFWVIKAYPGIGKTSFGFQILRHVCRQGIGALGMSAEMLAEAIGIRLISGEGKIDGLKLQSGDLDNDMMGRLGRASCVLADLPLWIDDRANMTLTAVEAVTSRLVRNQGIRVVLVDYIQLLKPVGNHRSRQEAVAEMSAGLKGLAKKHKITIIGLSQCNADGQAREARDIEQDADMVGHIKRDDKAAARAQEHGIELMDTPIQFILEKMRGGRTGSWSMTFEGATTTFLSEIKKPSYEEN